MTGRHSSRVCESGNPGITNLDSRLRGNDDHASPLRSLSSLQTQLSAGW